VKTPRGFVAALFVSDNIVENRAAKEGIAAHESERRNFMLMIRNIYAGTAAPASSFPRTAVAPLAGELDTQAPHTVVVHD